jgi:hypothetical protein
MSKESERAHERARKIKAENRNLRRGDMAKPSIARRMITGRARRADGKKR